MGTDKEDTDPSSPSALRPNSQPGAAAAAAHAMQDPPSAQPTTDPGLGPASGPPPVSARRPMGVTVPAPSIRPVPGPSAITPPDLTPIAAPVSAAPSPTKDSVELLLEGMAGPRPERRKTTPQSDGEASAAYHAEHGVRRARTSEPAGPKVVVERPTPASVSRERPRSPAPSKASLGSREALSTFVPARVLRRRVAMAVVAGVLFVLLSFMALRLGGRSGAAAGVPSAEATASGESVAPNETGGSRMPLGPIEAKVSPVEAPVSAVPASGGPLAPVVAEPLPVPSTRSFETVRADDARPAPAHATGGGTTRHHHAPADAPAASGDLGEFKTKF